jgi:hypothetical protein
LREKGRCAVKAYALLRLLGCTVLLAPAAAAVARVVPIKEDPSARITAYHRVPPEAVAGLTGLPLQNKVVRYPTEYAPRQHDIRYPWYVYAECDNRLILSPQMLTPASASLQINCRR